LGKHTTLDVRICVCNITTCLAAKRPDLKLKSKARKLSQYLSFAVSYFDIVQLLGWCEFSHKHQFPPIACQSIKQGAQHPAGDNLRVVCAEFSTLSLPVFLTDNMVGGTIIRTLVVLKTLLTFCPVSKSFVMN